MIFILDRKSIRAIVLKLIGISIVILVTISCSKTCEPQVATCNEKPPSGEFTCTAFFENWFYDPDKNKCDQIGYSGCSPRGFESKEECEKCTCR